MMFHVIGGIVVYGFALYGVARLLGRRKGVGVVEAVNSPDDWHRSVPSEAMARPTNGRQAGMDVDSVSTAG